MGLLIISILLTSIYYALSPYPVYLSIGIWSFEFNLTLAVLAVSLVFLLGMVLATQYYSICNWFHQFHYNSLERRLELFYQRQQFEREASTFLMFLSKGVDEAYPQKAQTLLQDSYYRPHKSFIDDTENWHHALIHGEYHEAYSIIKNAEPYLPREYVDLWLLKTLKSHLSSIDNEEQLRNVLRKIPNKFYQEPSFVELFINKIALLSRHSEARRCIQYIPAHLITEQQAEAMWSWMRHHSLYWYEELRYLWPVNICPSPPAYTLLVKLALGSDKIVEARDYLEKMPISSERFYLEYVLRSHADKRLDLLTGNALDVKTS